MTESGNTTASGSFGDLNAANIAQADANLRLASRFIEEFLADPDRYDPIPQGAAVILLPPPDEDDPALRAANLAMARKLEAQGQKVIYWTVGAAASTPRLDAEDSVAKKPA